MKEIILLISTLVFFFLGYWAMGKVDLFLQTIWFFEESQMKDRTDSDVQKE